METKKKWLIFWGVWAALIVCLFSVVLMGHFPQFTIPFSVFAGKEEKEKKVIELPKLSAIALKDVHDQDLLNAQLEKIDQLNNQLKLSESFSSSQMFTQALTDVFQQVTDEKAIFALYHTIYPMISGESSGFVRISLVGFGESLRENQTVEDQKQVWTFTDAKGDRKDYLVTLAYTGQALISMDAKPAEDTKTAIMTKDDTYLDKTADFETVWSDVVMNFSDERLYQQMAKAGLNANQTEFQALEKSVPLIDKSGFFDLFTAAKGDLRHTYLSGFFHSNSPEDGRTFYYFRVPTGEKSQATFKVVYDRLQQKILSIHKQ